LPQPAAHAHAGLLVVAAALVHGDRETTRWHDTVQAIVRVLWSRRLAMARMGLNKTLPCLFFFFVVHSLNFYSSMFRYRKRIYEPSLSRKDGKSLATVSVRRRKKKDKCWLIFFNGN
jgi:hypothetical protein